MPFVKYIIPKIFGVKPVGLRVEILGGAEDDLFALAVTMSVEVDEHDSRPAGRPRRPRSAPALPSQLFST